VLPLAEPALGADSHHVLEMFCGISIDQVVSLGYASSSSLLYLDHPSSQAAIPFLRIMADVPSPNVQYKTVIGTIIGVIVANGAVIMRLVARRVGRLRLTPDDYLILIALVRTIRFRMEHTDSWTVLPLGHRARWHCQ
jgi:hypothetical protein